MQIKLLKNLIEDLAGVNSSRITDILFNKKDVNEFLIAKKMELTINQTRNILYKLSAEGLVSFTRKKDKRKGWYIYYWTLNTEKCLIKLKEMWLKKIDDLKHLLRSRESKRFYICKPCNIEVSEETALDHNFTCEECSEVYELADNTRAIKETKTKIAKTDKELEIIKNELEIIKTKILKKKARAEKKAEKEKMKKKKIKKKKIAKKKTSKKVKKKAKKKKTIKKKDKKIKKKSKNGKKIKKKKAVKRSQKIKKKKK